MSEEAIAFTSFAPEARSHAGTRGVGARLGELIAVGGLTPLLFPLAWWLRQRFGLDPAELAVGFVMFHAAHAINDPHFAITYLVFYRDARARAFGGAFKPAQRVRYLAAGVLVPLALGAWAGAALAWQSVPALAALIQLMFALVGWHYVKQGFGVLLVLAARRGVRFTRGERLALLAHAFAGWAYAWASPAAPSREVDEKGLVYTTIPRPRALEQLTQLALWATLIALVWVLVQRWRRERRLPLFTPLLAFLCSIWSWTIYAGSDPLVRYLIPALHSLQYLYIVWLMTRNEAREREGPPWFEASAGARVGALALSALGLGWLLFHGAPHTLDGVLVGQAGAASALGPTPYFAALYAFVNIHHYFMDAVIWRHDNPLTRYLRVPAAGEEALRSRLAGEPHAPAL